VNPFLGTFGVVAGVVLVVGVVISFGFCPSLLLLASSSSSFTLLRFFFFVVPTLTALLWLPDFFFSFFLLPLLFDSAVMINEGTASLALLVDPGVVGEARGESGDVMGVGVVASSLAGDNALPSTSIVAFALLTPPSLSFSSISVSISSLFSAGSRQPTCKFLSHEKGKIPKTYLFCFLISKKALFAFPTPNLFAFPFGHTTTTTQRRTIHLDTILFF